jgi:hypothetical protein
MSVVLLQLRRDAPVTPTVRLIGLTAPIHDAEDLGLMGPPDIAQFVENTGAEVSGWQFIDVLWLVETPPLLTKGFTDAIGGSQAITNPEFLDEGDFDKVVVKLSMSDLADAFVSAQYEVGMDATVREVLGVMWDMVVEDFPEVFAETNPRDTE